MTPCMRRALMFALGVLLATGCGAREVGVANGADADWDQWAGKWIVINYWAEWCKPCRVELPELNRLHAAGADAGVVVLGVNFDGLPGEALERLIDEFQIEFPVLLEDPASRWSHERPSVLPTTLVIDPEGTLHEVLVGPQTFESLAEAVGLEPED
jgi:thiol-disulfide isomerase/thioredoxin